jgi:hypothetical protein
MQDRKVLPKRIHKFCALCHTVFMRIQIVFILCAWLVGCSEADQDKLWPRGSFELASGQVVSCRWADQTPCGVKLYDCEGGGVYTCQQGVVER